MQEIEGVTDEPHLTLAVGRRLGIREAWHASLIDAAELAIDVSGLDVEICERCNGAWILVGPIEAGPSQELYASIVDARHHAVSVQFDFMQPLRARRRRLDRMGKLRSDELRKRDASTRRTGLNGLRGGTLDGTRLLKLNAEELVTP
jgi:hypothetical protein